MLWHGRCRLTGEAIIATVQGGAGQATLTLLLLPDDGRLLSMEGRDAEAVTVDGRRVVTARPD